MKKILLLLLILSNVVLVNAKTKYATLRGRFITETQKEITLYSIINGDLTEYAKTKIGKDGYFAFSLIPDTKEFYYIGTKDNYFRVYFQSGEILNVVIDEDKELMSIEGKATKENKLLLEWQNIISTVKTKAVANAGIRSIYTDFYPDLNETVKKYEEFISNIDSKDKEFCEMLKFNVDSDIRYYALAFLASGRMKHPEKGNITDFHKKILEEDLISDRLLSLPYAWQFINAFYSASKTQGYTNDENMDFIMNRIKSPSMKSTYVIRGLSRKKTSDSFYAYLEQYGKYIVNAKDKNTLAAYSKEFKDTKVGNSAIDFTYPDANGKSHSLSDYKGKVVLVDVWATWCGPCVKEIPHLMRLEEELAGKDVVVIGVSMDQRKSKWLDFIKKENLKGVQLLGDQTIRDNYKIDGIPRFMIFDKKGNIVSTDAPRPSNPTLKAMILRELAK